MQTFAILPPSARDTLTLKHQFTSLFLFNFFSKIYSYSGEHYSVSQLGQVSLHLNRTANGLDWEPIGTSPFYTGGISEVGEYLPNAETIFCQKMLQILFQAGPLIMMESCGAQVATRTEMRQVIYEAINRYYFFRKTKIYGTYANADFLKSP